FAMEKAMELDKPVVFAVGNAPTALGAIVNMKELYGFSPVGVVGVPVGFVNVEASKELLIDSGIPCIVNRGRKGGSNIAACIINAIQYAIRDGIAQQE
ncbi:MAG: precorrin-8X methylmutase, partial [Firmicutes bacterium]|nr:precorrin-8X methylmutase [Bacillota bacterium]